MILNIPEPYRSIKDLPYDAESWLGPTNAYFLDKFIKDRPIHVAVEIGSWIGSSARFIASRLQENGILYAVDSWLGTPEANILLQDPRLPHLFQLFLSNIKYAGLTHKVVPVRMYSVMAAQILDIKADLIYIDAAHDYQNVLDDIMAWHPHLTQGGVMCGDDWSLYEGVSKAVLQAAKELNVKVYGVDNFWWFEP
ncbi:MAG: class I SAM-dependent methyltransferase [Parachlamydiaceae bacterium]